MASRPPLGLSLADILGQSAPAAPKMSRGQIIAGIIGDALAGAAGRSPTFGPMVARQKEEQQQAAQEEAQWGRHLLTQELVKQQFPDPSPMARDVQAWQGMTPEQRAMYQQMQTAREGDPMVLTPLPNGQIYSGPRSGLAAAMMGGGSGAGAAPTRPVGPLTPIPDSGGPTQPASGGFLGAGHYPDIGPYKRY